MPPAAPDPYATLGLDRRCTLAQTRAAYRALARRHHPDLNPQSPAAVRRTQEINAAYAILGDPARRREHDGELAAGKTPGKPSRPPKIQRNLSQDIHLRLEDFLRGTQRIVRVNDPANPHGPETYELVVPQNTAPGTRFRLPRAEPFAGGCVQLRVRALPDFRCKVRGSDLRCDLKIKPQRARQGGVEMIQGISGALVRVPVPRGACRHEIVRVAGEGLPKPHGGRGDLLVRLTYCVEVRSARAPGR